MKSLSKLEEMILYLYFGMVDMMSLLLILLEVLILFSAMLLLLLN